jgi:hypothetical protein
MAWRKKQLIQPDLAVATDVPFQVKASSTLQTADMVNFFDRDGSEAYTLTQEGLSAFGGASETARVNIKHGGAPLAKDPDSMTSSPVIWFRADDITGVGDGNPTDDLPLPEKTGNFPSGWTVMGGGTEGVDYHSATGGNPINGHAWIGRGSSPTKLALQATEDGSTQFNGDFSILCVYKPRPTADTNASWMLGRRNVAGDAQGLGAPIKSNFGRCFVYTATSDDELPSGAPYTNTNNTDVKIILVRRTGSVVTAFGTNASGDGVEFGTITNSGQITFNGLFRAKEGTVAEESLGIAEIVVFDYYLTANEYLQLYQYYAQRFDLTALTTGGGGDMVHCYDASDNQVVVVDDLGYVGIGDSINPTARLHVKDPDLPLRLAWDDTYYWDFEISDSENHLNINNPTYADAYVGIGTYSTPDTDILSMLDVRYSGTQFGLSRSNTTRTYFTVQSDGDLTISQLGTSKFVGINNNDPVAGVDIRSVGPQLRISPNVGSYVDFIADSAGKLIVQPSGGRTTFSDSSIFSVGTVTIDTDPVNNAYNLSFIYEGDLAINTIFSQRFNGNLTINPQRTGGEDMGIGINITDPNATLFAGRNFDGDPQFKAGYDDSNYMAVTVTDGGATTFNSVGATPGFIYSDHIRGDEPINYSDTMSQDITVPANNQIISTEVYTIAQGAILTMEAGARMRVF